MSEFIIKINALKKQEAEYGWTVLHMAAIYGQVKVCESIMKHINHKNPKFNLVGGYGNPTPLHNAAELGHVDVCELIIKQIDDKHPRDNKGWTPLHYAADNGTLEICELIIKNIKDKHPRTIHSDSKSPISFTTGYLIAKSDK